MKLPDQQFMLLFACLLFFSPRFLSFRFRLILNHAATVWSALTELWLASTDGSIRLVLWAHSHWDEYERLWILLPCVVTDQYSHVYLTVSMIFPIHISVFKYIILHVDY